MMRTSRPACAYLVRTIKTLAALVPIITVLVVANKSEAGDELLSGTWQLADSAKENESRQDAIKAITNQLPRIARKRVEDKLRSSTDPVKTITISFQGDQVLLAEDNRQFKLTLDAKSVEVAGKQGKARVAATRKEGHLVLAAKADNATRTAVFRPSENGETLVLDVSLNVSRIGATVRYQTKYVRR